jgi:type IV secretion system protein VirD4
MLKLKEKLHYSALLLLVAMFSLQLLSQFTSLLLGRYHWAPFFEFIDEIREGYYLETGIIFALFFFLAFTIVAILKGGFLRFMGYLLLLSFIVCVSVFIGSYAIFTYLYLDNFYGPTVLESIFIHRLQEPLLWSGFLKTEGIGFLITTAIVAYLIFERIKPANKLLGNAHFSNGFEIKKAGFFKREVQSILIGKKYGVPLYANGFEHVLVFAPTGSGKTRSIGIPNLFHYPYSVVCNDVKLTMFQTTSGYREKHLGNKCYCWAPSSEDGNTHRYNPLSLISNDKIQRITDIQRIAHILIPDNKKSDPIWQQASRKLFKVAVLYLLDTPERPTTLGEINRLIKQPQFDDWLATQLEETKHLDPEFYRNGYSYLNNHEKTRSSILESFSGYFELFEDPRIDVATSSSDFDLKALRKEKITIYIGFSDDDMERLSPLLTLFWQQLMSLMIQRLPCPKEEPYPLLCLIDEFSSLGRIERLRRSLKLLREYRVRCILMLQYIAQTYEQYTHDEAKAFTNIKTKIAFAAEDIQDAEYISKLLGMKTIKLITGSTSTQVNGSTESKNYSYQAVPLLRAEEIVKFNPKYSLIVRSGNNPVIAQQFIWYNELYKNLQIPSSKINQVSTSVFVTRSPLNND